MSDDDKKVANLESGIQTTRANMDQTIGEIGQILDPEKLKAQAHEQIDAVKEMAKEQFAEAKEMAKEELRSAKESIKHEVQDTYREAKGAVREATIGRVEHMVQRASDTVSETSNGIIDTIKQNPIPAALAGIGLIWLFASARKSRRENQRIGVRYNGEMGDGSHGNHGLRDSGYGYDDRGQGMMDGGGDTSHRLGHQFSEAAVHARDAVGHAAHQASEAVSHAAHDVGDRAGSMAHRAGEQLGAAGEKVRHIAHDAEDGAMALGRQARDRAMKMEGQVEQTYRDNPLAIGAVALALGAAVGLALPRTNREDHLMGSARDKVVDRARDFAQDSFGKAQEVARRVGEEASRVAANEAKSQGLLG